MLEKALMTKLNNLETMIEKAMDESDEQESEADGDDGPTDDDDEKGLTTEDIIRKYREEAEVEDWWRMQKEKEAAEENAKSEMEKEKLEEEEMRIEAEKLMKNGGRQRKASVATKTQSTEKLNLQQTPNYGSDRKDSRKQKQKERSKKLQLQPKEQSKKLWLQQ